MSQSNKQLQVFYADRLVGTLAEASRYKIAFEYSDEWLEKGFSISPFSLPLKKQVFLPVKTYFSGLFGVFADSLPDAWGRLLLERLLKSRGEDVGALSVLDRLAIVGESGMGALTYHPHPDWKNDDTAENLDELAAQCKKILKTARRILVTSVMS